MSRTRILVKVGLWVWCCLLPAAQPRAQENAKPESEANSPEQAFQAAQTFQVAGDYERAAAAYREAVSGALQQLGNLRVSNNEYAEGIDLLSRAVKAAPTRVTARVDLAIAHFVVRDFDKAKREIEAALEQDPKDLRALNLAGKIDFMKGDFAAAANRLESALRMQTDFDTGYLLALADLEMKNPVPAGVIFDEMQASSVPSASLHVLIGLAYRETGYFDQAANHFVKAIELEPQKARVRSSLGLTYYLQGPQNYAKAREQFLAELSKTPDDYDSKYYLGMIAEKEQKPSESEKWFELVTSARADDPDAFFRLGRASFDAGHLEKAVAALQKSLVLTSNDANYGEVAEVHDLMSKALEELNRHAEAESELTQAKRIRSQLPGRDSPPAPDTFTGSGEAAAMSGSRQQELRSMLMRAPHGPELPNSREAEYVKRVSAMLGEAYHNLGVIEARAARYSNAEEEFAEAARWNPKIESLDRNWGLAAFRAERYEHAIGPLKRLLRQTPKDANVRQMLGLSYYMTEEFAKSAETFRPILDSAQWRYSRWRTTFFANVGARRELSRGSSLGRAGALRAVSIPRGVARVPARARAECKLGRSTLLHRHGLFQTRQARSGRAGIKRGTFSEFTVCPGHVPARLRAPGATPNGRGHPAAERGTRREACLRGCALPARKGAVG